MPFAGRFSARTNPADPSCDRVFAQRRSSPIGTLDLARYKLANGLALVRLPMVPLRPSWSDERRFSREGRPRTLCDWRHL
jgi:hypothetical protein